MTPGSKLATTFTTPSDREIVATRVFDAPRILVWECWTNPEHVPHWMTGPVRISVKMNVYFGAS